MEGKQFLKSIEILMSEENDVVNLLLKIVDLLYAKTVRLNKTIAGYNSSIEDLKSENDSLKKQIEEKAIENAKFSELIDRYKEDLSNAYDKINGQKSTILELTNEKDALGLDLSNANLEINKLKGEADKTKELYAQQNSEMSDKIQLIKTYEQSIQTLTQDKNDLNASLNKVIGEKSIEIVKAYARVFLILLVSNESKESHWKQYIEEICQRLRKFIKEIVNIDTLTYSIKSSNSWLTKISSINWWSKQVSTSYIVNENVQNIKALNEVFIDFVEFIKNIDIRIQLPSSDISGEINNYEINLKENTNFNNLFCDHSFSEGDLCEIYKLSINENKGLCLIIKS